MLNKACLKDKHKLKSKDRVQSLLASPQLWHENGMLSFEEDVSAAAGWQN